MVGLLRHNNGLPGYRNKGGMTESDWLVLGGYQWNRSAQDSPATNQIARKAMYIFFGIWNVGDLATVAVVSLGKALRCVVDKNEPIGLEYRGGLSNEKRGAITTQILTRMCGMATL